MKRLFVLLTFVLRSHYLNRWIVFVSDLLISLLATLLSLLFVAFIQDVQLRSLVMPVLLVSLFSWILSSLCCKTYTGIIRHSTISETGRIFLSSLIKVGISVIVLSFMARMPERMLLLILLLDLFSTTFFLTIIRVALILAYRIMLSNTTTPKKKMLVYMGDKDTSVSISGSLFNKLGAYHILGYLRFGDGNRLRVGGYPVFRFHDQKKFYKLVKLQGINSILFVNRTDLEKEKERLVRYCERLKISMLLLPPADQIVDGKINYAKLPQVRIEDLLGREEIRIDMDQISSELKGKVVLVTGAAGSIGSEICRQLCNFGLKKLVMYDSAETPMHNIRLELEEKFPVVEFIPMIGDVRSDCRVEFAFKEYRPHIVFHAAAYKHVPLMEENPCEAVRTNLTGTQIVADMSVQYGVERFVMVSTDKAVNPTNVMGASKRLAEIYVQSLGIALNKGERSGNTKFITTRFGNVLGSNGSVIPRFQEQLEKGGPLTVTHPDIIRYFMTIPEACRLVLEAAVIGKGNEIFVFDMGTPVKIADLAKRMIELAGLVPNKDIQIEFTGLRPGEKLYEELLAVKENVLPTSNEKIHRANVREYDYDDIVKSVSGLNEMAKRVDRLGTVVEMKRIIPEFKSNNSEFEVLDKVDVCKQKDKSII